MKARLPLHWGILLAILRNFYPHPEPLPDGHELWSMPHVIITPHIAGRSREALQRVLALVAENLRRYVAGEPLLSVVNIDRGY